MIISMKLARSISLILVASSLTLGACAGSSKPAASADLYTVTPADVEALKSTEPLAANRSTLYVNGLSCPLCATNIDLQLMRVRGVTATSVDLSTGKIIIDTPGGTKPSPNMLNRAVTDAGATLVRIQSN